MRVAVRFTAGALLCMAAGTLSAAPAYTVTALGRLGGFGSNPNGINATGQVSGSAQLPGTQGEHAFLHDGSRILDLGTLGGASSVGASINAGGQVTGYSETLSGPDGRSGAGPRHAFLYRDGRMADIGTLGGGYSIGHDINDAGQIAGSSLNADGVFRAFVYGNGAMLDIGTLGGSSSTGNGINASGQVTGGSAPAGSSSPHAYIYTNGAMVDINLLGGASSEGHEINDRGQVTGRSQVAGGSNFRAFLYSDGAMIDLGTLGGSSSTGFGINNRAQIVGVSFTEFTEHGFLYDGGTLFDLNDLLDSPEWTIFSAADINDAGQIAAYGCRFRSDCQALRLDPVVAAAVPAPGSAALIGLGLASLVLGTRARRRLRAPMSSC